jgi:hypothetical protein
MRISSAMSKLRTLGQIFGLGVLLTLAIFPATRCAAKANPDDAVIDHFFSAIRDGNFKAATDHFSARMKALSPPGLQGSWDKLYANEGPLLRWKILQRKNLPNGEHEATVQLKFRHSTANSIIDLDPKKGEITSVLFKPPSPRAKSN